MIRCEITKNTNAEVSNHKMPILEANSEAFLDLIKSLQKGKGKSYGSLSLPQSITQQLFTIDDWKSPATVTKDVDTASPPSIEDAANGHVEPIGTPPAVPGDDPLMLEETAADEDLQEIGATSPALAEYPAAEGHSEPKEQSAVDQPFSRAHHPDIPFGATIPSSPEPILSADPPPNDYANNYATSSADPTISELQITTRSMTTSGAATTQAETSAYTEKPASSRLPSPSPAASTPAATPAWPPELLSSGSEFLAALPQAGEAFKARIRGGEEREEEAASPAAPAPDDHDHQSAANFSEEPVPQPCSPHRSSPVKEPAEWRTPMETFNHPISPARHPQPGRPARDSLAKWHHPHFHFSINSVPEPPPPQSNPTHDSNAKRRREYRYTEVELRRIGLESQRSLFENLLAMEGRGRVKVGIVRQE